MNETLQKILVFGVIAFVLLSTIFFVSRKAYLLGAFTVCKNQDERIDYNQMECVEKRNVSLVLWDSNIMPKIEGLNIQGGT